MSTKKKYTKPTVEEVIATPEETEEVIDTNVSEDTPKEEIPVDITDETKLVEEFVKAESTETAPLYHIRVEWSNTATQKESFTDINTAIKECNKYPGYSVFTEEGNPIHFSTAVIRMSSNNAVPYPGKRYDLKGAKLFANATIETAKGIADGTYYLYDAKCISGRFRVVDNKNKVGKGIQFIAGYVAQEEMY